MDWGRRDAAALGTLVLLVTVGATLLIGAVALVGLVPGAALMVVAMRAQRERSRQRFRYADDALVAFGAAAGLAAGIADSGSLAVAAIVAGTCIAAYLTRM